MVEAMEPEELVSTYGGMIYNIALHIVSVKEDAEDAYSETFLNYFRRDWEFESEDHRRNWLVRVATNCAYSILRGRHYEAPLDDDLAEILPAPEKADREERMDVRQAVEALPPIYRDIVMLYYYQGLSVREICQVLDIPENTAKSRLAKARERLSHVLTPYEN